MIDTPRLIKVAFPLKQASLDSVYEKNVRHRGTGPFGNLMATAKGSITVTAAAVIAAAVTL
jgi:hypothetical protein